MLFKTRSAAVYGIDANLIDVEVDFSGVVTEKTEFSTVGLPDAAVRESRDRVRSAIKNSGFDIPPTRITINLAPADLKKEGSGFDLPIAIAILGAYGGLHLKDTSEFLWSASSVSTALCAPCRACCPSLLPRGPTESATWSFQHPMRARPPW